MPEEISLEDAKKACVPCPCCGWHPWVDYYEGMEHRKLGLMLRTAGERMIDVDSERMTLRAYAECPRDECEWRVCVYHGCSDEDSKVVQEMHRTGRCASDAFKVQAIAKWNQRAKELEEIREDEDLPTQKSMRKITQKLASVRTYMGGLREALEDVEPFLDHLDAASDNSLDKD